MTKTVLITGCSSGIGRASAEIFIARGWNVVVTARNPESLTNWPQAKRMLALRLDVTDEPGIAATVKSAVDWFGGIDVLVNNAGYGLFGVLEGASADQFERQFQTNVFGAAAMIRHLLPIMRQQHGGTIINISSGGGRLGAPFASAYHATKFALEGLSESLRFELKPHNIRVKLVEPGHVKTEFLRRSLEWATHSAYQPQLGNWMAQVAEATSKGASCEKVAAVIYKAGADTSWKLRYRAEGGPLPALHAILPDAIWRSMMSMGMNMQPRGVKQSATQS